MNASYKSCLISAFFILSTCISAGTIDLCSSLDLVVQRTKAHDYDKHNHQFFTINTTKLKGALSVLDLANQNIVEIGVGTGIFTKVLLEQGVDQVVGFENDLRLRYITPQNVEVRRQDIRAANLSFLQSSRYTLVANPPYYAIPFIKREIIDKFALTGVVLMVPVSQQHLFPDYKILAEFNNDDFYPIVKNAANKHLLIASQSLTNSDSLLAVKDTWTTPKKGLGIINSGALAFVPNLNEALPINAMLHLTKAGYRIKSVTSG